jgi:hypothetical protein
MRTNAHKFSPCHVQTKIRDTLNNLILKSPQNWQTSVGLPFFQIEGTVRSDSFPYMRIQNTPNTPAYSHFLVRRSSSGTRFASTCA